MYYVIVLTVKERKKTSMELQKVLSKYGHLIKTRLGIHETVQEEHEGLIVMHIKASKEADILIKELNEIGQVNAKLVKIK